MTADGWTSIAQDHYLTVSVHYVREGSMKEKVLHTRAVYTSQTGEIVAEEIGDILDEFNIKDRVVAVTVDNAANNAQSFSEIMCIVILLKRIS